MPLEAGLRWRLYCSQSNTNRTDLGSGNEGQESTVDQQEGDAGSVADDTGDCGLEGGEEEQSAGELCPLQQLKVTCLNVTLERYLTDRKADDEKFDLVTGDPSELQLNGKCKVSVDYQKADKYVGIIKQLLREHGWVFLYTRAVDYSIWDKAFRANGFDPLEYPWPMIRKTDTVQITTSPIPQNVTELLIGARKKGAGRPNFQPNITSTYKRPVSSRKRKFAVIDCCSEPALMLKRPNTREPLRTNQRSPEPMAEFLDTFCPPDGAVLDAFAGTLETLKASYMTGRRCVGLEAGNQCFKVALQALKENAKGYYAEKQAKSAELGSEADTRNDNAMEYCAANLARSAEPMNETDGSSVEKQAHSAELVIEADSRNENAMENTALQTEPGLQSQ